MDDATAAMTPDERLAQGLCCECGLELADIDIKHHSMQHWPEFIRPNGQNNEAIRRQGLLTDYATSHPPAAKTGSTPRSGAPSSTPAGAHPATAPSERR